MDTLKAKLAAQAETLGFAKMGVASVGDLGRDAQMLHRWLRRGFHGEMDYMAKTAAVRTDVTHEGMLPTAKSVVMFATPYARSDGPDGLNPGRIARYARGRDYHNVLRKRMRKLAKLLWDEGFEARASIDTLPLMERAWAQRAGLGFLGKNSCLIIPGIGSHVFLSGLVTSAALPADEPMRERCGQCRLCLDACPTDAFAGERDLDARRCIAYLTIETRGPIDAELRPQIGPHLFGCDVCQDVCPYNRTSLVDATHTEPFAPRERLRTTTASDLLKMNEEAFLEWANGSPMRRPGREGMARNAAIVLGNSRDKRHLPILRETAAHHDLATVRDAAAWATQTLTAKGE